MVTNLHILSIKMEIKLITKNTNVPNSSGKSVDRGNIDPHKIQIHDCLYIYSYFPGFVLALQLKVAGLNYLHGTKTSLS
jgi:hypothetical protein